jgi:hypothetical protein
VLGHNAPVAFKRVIYFGVSAVTGALGSGHTERSIHVFIIVLWCPSLDFDLAFSFGLDEFDAA